MNAAVFIDKDGTLVEDVPDNVDPERLRFAPQALPALRTLMQAGFVLVVVTNQPGLAQGLFTRLQFGRLCRALVTRAAEEGGVRLTGVHACPHAPATEGRPGCRCRKPSSGLLERAARLHRVDLARSWMVGDNLDDVEAGRRAGCRTVLLDIGHEALWQRGLQREPHYRCRDWGEVAHAILHDVREGR